MNLVVTHGFIYLLVLKLANQFTVTRCRPYRLTDPAIKEFAAEYTDVDFIKD